ncbi:MAG: glycosyltransferase family 2 protein [Chlorobi bacterium]|nr:glycosyltransferase family 2 protein [Chlorobiota bacterium]
MKHSIVIITRNRPEEVRMVVHDLMSQTIIPQEIIIVDASDEKLDVSDLQENRECTVVKVLTSRPDICKQRNMGLQSARGEIITFFDDDVRLPKNYCEVVLQRFAEDKKGEVVAIGGKMKNPRVAGRIEVALRKLLMVPSFDGRNRVLRSGIPDFGYRFLLETRVDFLSTTALSVRASSAKTITFEAYWHTRVPKGIETGRRFGEDVLFTLRLGALGAQIILPSAEFEHWPSHRGRESAFEIQALYSFFLKYVSAHMVRSVPERLLRAWALIGQGLICLVQTIRFRDVGYINGYLLAMKAPCPESPDLSPVRRKRL